MNGEGVLKQFFYGPLRHLYYLLTGTEYRRYSWLVSRYGRTPRHTTKKIYFANTNCLTSDVASFLSAYRQVFVEEIYKFKSLKTDPIILDCGANVGLSILYFKKIFPRSKIIAFEADPLIAKILKENVRTWALSDVNIIQQAVWTQNGSTEFYQDGADGGRMNKIQGVSSIKVPTTRLRDILRNQKVDLLKMDIEGAESAVIEDCRDSLEDIKNIFVEYHSFADQKQSLHRILDALLSQGFRVHAIPEHFVNQPFLNARIQSNMDLQMNLFFWKD